MNLLSFYVYLVVFQSLLVLLLPSMSLFTVPSMMFAEAASCACGCCPDGCLNPPTVGTATVSDCGQCTAALCTSQFGACSGTQSASCSSSGSVTYSWTTGGWSTCSADSQTRSVVCSQNGGSNTGGIVADSNCQAASKPATTQSCTAYVWGTSIDWGACDQGTCLQVRGVYCKEYNDPSNSVVSDSYCSASTRPANSQSCCSSSTTYVWQADSWSTCSSSCTETRSVLCKSNSATVSDSYCSASTKPETSQQCCDSQSYTYGWLRRISAACSRCTGGTQTYSVTCQRSDGVASSDSYCDSSSKPPTQESCSFTCQPDPLKPTYSWIYSGHVFCNCSSKQTLEIAVCRSEFNNVREVVSDYYCNQSTRPTDRVNSCLCQWSIGPYFMCSNQCGTGIAKREVKCYASTDVPFISIREDTCYAYERFLGPKPQTSTTCEAFTDCPSSIGRTVIIGASVGGSVGLSAIVAAVYFFIKKKSQCSSILPCVSSSLKA